MTDNDKSEIGRLRAAGHGYGKIAQALGISVNTIKSYCRRKQMLQDQAEPAAGEISLCDNCGKEIQQLLKRKKKRFCCDKCRNQWWNSHMELVNKKAYHIVRCRCCYKDFPVYGNRVQSERKYCSRECYFKERFGGKA